MAAFGSNQMLARDQSALVGDAGTAAMVAVAQPSIWR